MLAWARGILPKHKHDCVNLLLKTLQSLPRGFPSPNLERSPRHAAAHSSLPLQFQHLPPPTDAACVSPGRPPTAAPTPVIPQPASPSFPLQSPEAGMPSLTFSGSLLMLRNQAQTSPPPCYLFPLAACPRAWKTVGVLKECLQNEQMHSAMNLREEGELLRDASEKGNYNRSLILQYLDFKGGFSVYSKEP